MSDVANPPIQYRSVSSSSIAEVGYDRESTVLVVRFHNGAEYRYFSVPETVFEGFLAAHSAGGYFHERVRNAAFRYEQTR